MVAIVNTNPSLRDALQYNENKVKEGQAELIHSSGYPKDTHLLGFTDKIKRLQNQAVLNQQTQNNAVHITINFHPSEKLERETLKEIADSYMEKIGFGDQPYLVYEHRDAGHPHMHIVTTNIQASGKGINTFNIGKIQSKKAREEIEQAFGLIKAKGRGKGSWELPPVDIQRVQYGKTETKRAIASVVNYVTQNYKFASIPELNAILQQFNVYADRGSKDSRIYRNGGLVYRVLDENGNKIGPPIKSSLFSTKLTLKDLQTRFGPNERGRQPFAERVRNAIDLAFLQNPGIGIRELAGALETERVRVVLRQNDQGIVYGITYVDHGNKCVFNGSDLGKSYSAKAILERCRVPAALQQKTHFLPGQLRDSPYKPRYSTEKVKQVLAAFGLPAASGLFSPLLEIMIPTMENEQTPYELTAKKKKKKKRKY